MTFPKTFGRSHAGPAPAARRLWPAVVLTAAAAGLGGWLANEAFSDRGAAAPGLAKVQANKLPSPLQNPVVAAGDGTVSVHIDNAPLDWLMEELVRHGARRVAAAMPAAGAEAGAPSAAGKPSVAAASTGSEPVAAAAPAETDEDVAAAALQGKLVRALEAAAPADSHAALSKALNSGALIPPTLLQRLYQSAGNESTRLLAFTAHVEAVSDDREAVRAALVQGTNVGHAGVQAEAYRRLAELDHFERVAAAAKQ